MNHDALSEAAKAVLVLVTPETQLGSSFFVILDATDGSIIKSAQLGIGKDLGAKISNNLFSFNK